MLKIIVKGFHELDYHNFAYDGCHKMYLLKDEEIKQAEESGYKVIPIDRLPQVFNDSCPSRFLYSWRMDYGRNEDQPLKFIPQGEKVKFITESESI